MNLVLETCTCRAQEVASVYAQLSGGTASSADRMDTLLHARLMLSQYGHSMFGPLELVDREIDMLKRCLFRTLHRLQFCCSPQTTMTLIQSSQGASRITQSLRCRSQTLSTPKELRVLICRGRSTASLLPLRLRLIDALRIAHASSQSSHKSVK